MTSKKAAESSAYMESIDKHFLRLANDDSPKSLAKLREYLLIRDSGTYEKHIVPFLACRALVSKGVAGIEVLAEVLSKAPGHIYPNSILSTLWHAGDGEHAPSTFPISEKLLNKPITREVRQLAREKFAAFLAYCRTDPEALYRLISLLDDAKLRNMGSRESWEKYRDAVFRLLADTTLRISEASVANYERLLGANAAEEKYQKFLQQNPIFLNPLASRLIEKHRLGDDFITDYVLEPLTGDYLAVEIEKARDPIFTRNNDFSSQFAHAFGQVIDFIDWIEQNVAYAQTKLSGITSPRGLLVIGRRATLTPKQENKLRRFNRNSAIVEVLTFDDLLFRARSLLRNIRVRASDAHEQG